MDRLWSPWRYQFVGNRAPAQGCIFCLKPVENSDAGNLIVHRAEWNFVILNLYPYTTGHLMIVPFAHVPSLASARPETLAEMMLLAQRAEQVLTGLYRPQGFNAGLNLGECAGAGIAGHLHLHLLPRWTGDANFMTTACETRVMPEDLGVTYRKLRLAWNSD